MRSRPVPFVRLVDLVEGRLPAEEEAQLRAQIEGDERSTADVRWLERVMMAMRRDATWSEVPPEEVRECAVELFRTRGSPSPPKALQRLHALLNFDSLQVPQPVGIRSGQLAERQLLFTAAELSIDLRVTPAGALWAVGGQVLGPLEGGGQVMLSGTDTNAEAALNELSEFVLPPVPAGDYTLTLHLRAVEIEVERLRIGS